MRTEVKRSKVKTYGFALGCTTEDITFCMRGTAAMCDEWQGRQAIFETNDVAIAFDHTPRKIVYEHLIKEGPDNHLEGIP